MNNTPKFFHPLWGNLQGKLNASAWPVVAQAWQEKRYQDCFYSLLDYINPSLRVTYGNSTQTEFKVPHGSVIVTMKLNNGTLEVDCPMVDISAAIKLPLMRKAAELNFYPLALAQMKLNGNNLSFQYTSSLDTCEPFKTYYTLKEICQTADRYDDEFNEKFKAKSIVEPKVVKLSPQHHDTAWNNTSEIINETFSYLAYFDSQRWFGSSLDYLILAVKRLDLTLQPQGFLKNELERINGILCNSQLTLPDRTATGKKFLQQVQQMGKDTLAKSLYQAEVFIPEKWRTNAEQVKAAMQNALEQTKKFHGEGNYIAACMEAHYCIYDLFYKNNMDEPINNILIGALTNASGKTWQEASGILCHGLQTISVNQF
jgi:hypothetical protein